MFCADCHWRFDALQDQPRQTFFVACSMGGLGGLSGLIMFGPASAPPPVETYYLTDGDGNDLTYNGTDYLVY